MDYAELARQTIAFLKPELVKNASNLAKDGLALAREAFCNWLKTKFSKPAQAVALAEASEAPEDAGALEVLQLQLRLALERQEDFRNELLERLPKEFIPQGINQATKVSGDANVTIQNAGGGTINVQH